MKITDLFRSLKQITVNTIDISFIKSSLNLLVKRANKNTIQMDTMQSEIDKVKEKTKDLKIIEGKIDALLLPSYVELVKDVYKDTITNEFYNVIVNIDPVTLLPSYSRGDTEVLKVLGIIYHDVNENRVYRVSDLGRIVEITTSENYYTKEEADSNFASSTIKSTKVVNITSEYDNILIGNESLTNYISDTSYSNILSWINSGNLVIAKYNTSYYTLSNIVDNSIIFSTVTDSKTIETFTINDNDRVYYSSKQINVPELYVVPLTGTISSLDIARYLDYLNDGKPVIFKQVTTSMDNPRVRLSMFIPVSYYYLDESSIHLWGFGEGGLNHITFTPQDAHTYHGNIEVMNLAFANDIDQLYLDKLDELLSGINIKTINNIPLTGSGDVRTTIVVTFRRLSPTSIIVDKTATEIITAVNNGFDVIASDAGTITGTLGGSVMQLSRWDSQPNMAIVLFYNVDGSTKCINTLSIVDINNSTSCVYNLYNLLEKLISGTNIKTVDGISLLGSGNINTHDTLSIYIIEEAIPGSNATTFVVDTDGNTLADLYSWLDSGKTIIPYVIFLNTNRTYVGWLSETHSDWLLFSVIIPTEGDNDPYTPHNVNIIIFRIIEEDGYFTAIPKFNRLLIDADTYVNGMQHKLEALANVSVSSPELYYYDGTYYDFGITDIVVFDNIFQNSNMYNPSNGRKPIWYFTFVAETSACSVTLPTGTILANGYTWNMLANRKFFVKIVDNVAFVDWADPA